MLKRRRFKPTDARSDRLSASAKDAREKAVSLPVGVERVDLLKRARQADTEAHIEEWINSRGLQPPT